MKMRPALIGKKNLTFSLWLHDMTNKDRIFKGIAFIESHLKSDIGLADIAQESGCSLYHFVRLFQNIIDIPPKKYLLLRRLTESARQLRNSNEKIASIAFDYQFNSHEVFSRSFQKYFGTTPSKVKKGEVIPAHLLIRPITKDYIFQSKKARNQSPKLVELEERIAVGVSYFIEGDLSKLELSREWNAFMKMVDLINHKTTPEQYFQIQYWSEHQDVEGMHFFLGMEVNTLKDISPDFAIKIIPKGTYLRFVHEGLSRNVGFTYRYIYNEFLPNTQYKLVLPFNFECYGANCFSPDNEKSESYVFIPVDNTLNLNR